MKLRRTVTEWLGLEDEPAVEEVEGLTDHEEPELWELERALADRLMRLEARGLVPGENEKALERRIEDLRKKDLSDVCLVDFGTRCETRNSDCYCATKAGH